MTAKSQRIEIRLPALLADRAAALASERGYRSVAQLAQELLREACIGSHRSRRDEEPGRLLVEAAAARETASALAREARELAAAANARYGAAAAAPATVCEGCSLEPGTVRCRSPYGYRYLCSGCAAAHQARQARQEGV